LLSVDDNVNQGFRSGGHRLTKQGNPMLRCLWCEAAIHAVRRDAASGRFDRRKLQQKGLGKARIAFAGALRIARCEQNECRRM
jgi:transposase